MKLFCIDFTKATIEIELSDHPVVQKWARDFELLPAFDYEMRWWKLEGQKTDHSHHSVVNNIEALKCSVEFLKTQVPDFNFEPLDQAINDFKQTSLQQPLNVLHRAFTTLVMFHKRYVRPKEVWDAVHQINTSVHILEGLVASEHNLLRQQYPSQMYSLSFIHPMEHVSKFGVWKKPMTDVFDHRVENTDFDVWINEDILGKDLIRCYLDGDDPNNLDISGNLYHTPNILIDSDRAFHKILKSKDFNDWFDKSLKEPKQLNRWPIGRVRNLKNLHNSANLRVLRVYIREEI